MTFSINTNVGAQIALQSLGVTSSQLAATEKQISTGYRVADATDDGAAYAVAQGVRATVGALTSANQQLGNVNGLLTTTLTGLNSASNTINDLNAVLVKLSDGNTQGSQRTQYQAQYNTDISELKTQLNGANYNGKTLIGNVGGAPAGVTFGRTAVVQDQIGTTYGIATFSGNSLYTSLNVTTFTSTAAQTFLTGTFARALNTIGNQLNSYGASSNYVGSQVSYNSDKIDALNTGLGSLIDANLAQESAQLQALQIRQQLGTQALSLANQAPQTLLSLFK
ncbi:MAG TPA: flagellin [Acetobacteraceae bacterium]